MEGLHGEIAIGIILLITGLSALRIEFIIEDDKTTVESAVEAFNKLSHQDGGLQVFE